VIDLEMKLKVMVIARLAGIDLGEQEQSEGAVTGSASLKATRLTIIREWPISDM